MAELREAPPKYLQIAEYIRDQIASGDLCEGDEVPSERQIALDWGVSRPTATRALGTLRSWDLVDSKQGSGTFVRAQPRLNRRARDRYARSRSSGRIYASGERARIVSAELTEAPENVLQAMRLANGSLAIRRKRIILADEKPVEVSWSWTDGTIAERAPRLLDTERIREGTVAYLERVTGRKAVSARDRVGARRATAEEAKDLGLETGAAVLVIHHTVYDEADEPLEFAEAVYPPDRWTLEQTYTV